MELKLLQQSALPEIDCQKEELPSTPFITLTQLVSCFTYDAPLTSGENGTLREKRDQLIQASIRDWRDPNGPEWLLEHLQLLAEEKEWRFDSDVCEEDRNITLSYFSKAKKWLAETNMSAAQALQDVTVKSQQRLAASTRLSEKTSKLYTEISSAIVDGALVLWGLRRFRDEIDLSRAKLGSAPHQKIPPTFLLLPAVHDLDANDIETDRWSDDVNAYRVFDDAVGDAMCRYDDVKLRRNSAEDFLATIVANTTPKMSLNVRKDEAVRSAINALGIQTLSNMPQDKREHEIIQWVAKNRGGLAVKERKVRNTFSLLRGKN